MQPQSGIKTWQWVVTAVVFIVLIIIAIWVIGGKTPSTTEIPVNTTDNSSMSGAINRVVMSDQYPGNVVYLNSAQFENPGWIVIQADNAGTPGKILGQTYFESGINPGKITLSSPMVDGGTYYAVMYSDNGDKAFNATSDLPLKDANGNIIMKVFHASASVSAQIKG